VINVTVHAGDGRGGNYRGKRLSPSAFPGVLVASRVETLRRPPDACDACCHIALSVRAPSTTIRYDVRGFISAKTVRHLLAREITRRRSCPGQFPFLRDYAKSVSTSVSKRVLPAVRSVTVWSFENPTKLLENKLRSP